jgi:hypothetical protein
MAQPPITQGATSMMDALDAALMAHLIDYLTVWSDETGRTMPAPSVIWRGDVLPTGFTTPWLSLYVPTSEYSQYDALGEWRVTRQLVVFVMLMDGDVQASGSGATDMSGRYMYEAMMDYGQAVAQCLEFYGPAPEFGGGVGVIDISPAADAEIIPEPIDRGEFVKFCAVRMTVTQRVRGRLGAPPPVITPP